MLFIALILFFVAGIYFFMQTAVFGARSSGKRLQEVKASANYKNKAFQNINLTPLQSENFSFAKTLWRFFNSPSNTIPSSPLPFVRTDLKKLDAQSAQLVWFGHSSYFIRIDGKNILVDPIFSGHASPVFFFTTNFEGSNNYKIDDFPELDVVLITHDHYDHLDHKTIIELQSKTKLFCTSLGVGAHLERWGIPNEKIIEFDWWESKQVATSIELTAAPAWHFSGRDFALSKSLWSSFILKTTDYKIYLGGDSGYDTHFKTIGEQFGPFDLALLECGQYNENWPYIHMMPEQTILASIDLQAKVLFPIHWGKFKLSLHSWKEPIERATIAAEQKQVRLTTPLIGEPISIGNHYPSVKWWENIV
ncbi:MAG: MBL fold metallo-hydrolase [Cyclobacteriaceae bacterium]|nr:MBL fold metallo-hydrolase [Cyclobacteriaceae bacterium]